MGVRPLTSVWTRLPLRLAHLSISMLRLALHISRSLSCPLAAAEPHAATIASFLQPRRPCRLLPQFAQCLPGLFPNPPLSGCVTAAAAPVDGGWAQVWGALGHL